MGKKPYYPKTLKKSFFLTVKLGVSGSPPSYLEVEMGRIVILGQPRQIVCKFLSPK